MGVIIFFIVAILIVVTIGRNLKKSNIKTANPIQDSKINMLLDFAALSSKHIQNNLNIDSPLIFYEQIYFFYFITDMTSIEKKSKSNRNNMLANLIQILENKHLLGQNDLFKDTFLDRYQNYMSIFIDSKYQFSNQFFYYVIEYQCLLIAEIDTKNRFSHINAGTIECTDYSWGIGRGCVYKSPEHEKRIKQILYDNLDLIKAYLAQCQ